jgi:SAM-dependent methyltransferase
MTSRPCPVCHADSIHARLFLEQRIDSTKLSAYSFASRKTPEFMNHRLMQCPTCDLVYVDQPPADAELARAYHEAEYDSSEEADDAAAAYIRAIRPILSRLRDRRSALEIGTGTGVFLEHLRRAGFEMLVGVEPSLSAITAAPESRRAWIRHGVFAESDFAPASFDLICCFMTMEHVGDPAVIASAALALLRPGGAFITIAHDYRSRTNRLLGRRSPIIDIEHMQLFSKKSLRSLYERTGYIDISVQPFANTYSMRYWIRLLPLPAWIRSAASKALTTMGADRLKLRLNVGNMIAAGFKPR